MANAGLSDLPIGLDCTRCGLPVTVDYIAHGDGSVDALVGDPMQELVAAAARMCIKRGELAQLCVACSPPSTERGFRDRFR